jgi:peptidoglycan/xylan/chitin deacetylase (PgdA/CDA1 family)
MRSSAFGPRAIARRAERGLERLGFASGILMYHRVARESYDPWDLCVTPRHFAEQMEVLKSAAACEPLASFSNRRWSRPSRRARLAITFDDGYRDNVVNALPILERYEIPATIFIVSGSIGSAQEFWWDTLERCLLRPERIPATLELEIAGGRQCWALRDDDAERGDGRSAWRADSGRPTARQRAFLDLWELLVTMDTGERDRHLDALVSWAGIDAAPATERLPMSLDELVELAKHPLITIGCHTVAHSRLPDLPPAAQRRAIGDCRDALEEWTGREITTFSYPYGRYNRVTSAIVRDLAFVLACSSRPATVTPLSDRWAMPRLQATDDDGDVFEHWLLDRFGALDGARRA